MVKHSQFISVVNTTFMDLVSKLQGSFQELGPVYSHGTWESNQYNLMCHRLCSKFEVPDTRSADERRDKAFDDFITYDISGFSTFEPALMDLDPYVRKVLYEARSHLYSHLRIDIDYNDIEITSGEQYLSSRGDTSVYAKLRDTWTSTRDNFDFFAVVAFNVRALRQVAKERFKAIGITHNQEEFMQLVRDTGSTQKACFEQFKANLLYIIEFVDGFRLETVPKNNDTDRVIGCEPFCNMICQRLIACSIRRFIKHHYGVDLLESQDLHKKLILDMENATVDLKNASNSNWMAVIEFLYPPSFVRKLDSARCKAVDLGGVFYDLNMLSPMGNGFTFEVMTLTLLTICRLFDSESYVYGDDIIVHRDCAHDLVNALESMGWQINQSKTFLAGSFRESCGGFQTNGRYHLSYEFRYAEDVYDAMVLTNKLHNLLSCTDNVLFHEAYHTILESAPLAMLRPDAPCVMHETEFGNGIFTTMTHRELLRCKRKDEYCRQQFKHMFAKLQRDELSPSHNSYGYKPYDLMFYELPVKTSISYKWTERDLDKRKNNTRNKPLAFAWLYAGRCSTPSVRRTKVKYVKILSPQGVPSSLV